MSRGPGIWQRRILSTIEDYPAFYLMDLLPKEHTRSQVVALNRPARQLVRAYKIDIHVWMCRHSKGGFITVTRLRHRVDSRKDMPRIGVTPVHRRHPCNTYGRGEHD
jgi:hypothetical protein